MRLDYVTIFPAFFAPLSLSLPGKAAASGLLDLHVHDLRDFAHDRHRTVDDSPYGGGAGMVMKAGPWGEALDALLPDGATLVVPTPSGAPLRQRDAEDLARCEHLVFACGRYEGIDQRVLDHVATRAEVREISLGDYVLNGGEVAALVITEAVVRLLPGFMGNAASLNEESHVDGLLEYPVYTKPSSWRGHDVPPVLLSGDHRAVERWRREQSLARTAARRPDLLSASGAAGVSGVAGAIAWHIVPAVPADAGELLTLQRACWMQEAAANDSVAGIPALQESLADVQEWVGTWTTYVVRVGDRLVGAARGRLQEDAAWHIGRIMVAPDLQGRGLGRVLLEHIQHVAPPAATAYVLFTGFQSEANLRMYKKAGFRLRRDLEAPPLAVVLTKRR